MPYDPRQVETKWQAYWQKHRVFRSEIDPSKPKFYALDMFPYPSGSGLHVGHPKGYISTDVLARYKRMRGFNVLHPMGWDAFGLPAEQYAIETGTHPQETTARNIEVFKRQLQALGLDYDWSREVNTTEPSYMRWTQWIFRKLYERDLAYLAEVPVNWCPALGTVLANEEVIDGKSERGSHPVVRMPMRQWMLRITAYADRLIDDLDEVDWPEAIKKMQRDWIGRSEGARIVFDVEGRGGHQIEVFTTRPDTLFGATYMVLAPEHPLVEEITSGDARDAVVAYVEQTARRSERDRIADTFEKSGVATGATALHPITGARLPIWIADYVLATYGTGAIMSVPAHDERDHAFARRFALPIIEVVAGGDDVQAEAFTGEGAAVNSDFLDGLHTAEAKRRICEWLEDSGRGEASVSYKLRDWLFSRQRYWGEPFPVLHLEDGSTTLVPEDDLPVLLPELDDFKPTGEFEPPLGRVKTWVETTDPATGQPARRDTNTMPQWAGSCWYYLRFIDPTNDMEPWSREAEQYWMPVDLYVGGAEHAVLHLLYSRFWHKVLFDLGLVHTKEPFQKLLNPGMILGYSYRYFDDDLADEKPADARVYAANEVELRQGTPRHRESGEELKARWVQAADVRFVGETPTHPTLDLELEVVTEKMSKSRGNVVNPDDVIEKWGTDTLRLYEMFMGPIEKGAPWSDESIPGLARFLQRIWRLFVDDAGALAPLAEGAGSDAQARLLARTIRDTTDDFEGLRFNTAISKLMVFVRDVADDGPMPREAAEAFTKLLSPLAPHLADELWERLGHSGSLARETWPEPDSSKLVEDTITLVAQVNGKRRDEIEVPADADEATVRAIALASEKVQQHLGGREPSKVIVVPGRLVNLVG
ncbi:MAG: leucine--tRNA ligase [Deltaproteobacteria bacterium]|nr:leucine--tRNA ligase [Deltaproteobacteria bacterium]